MGSKWTMGDTIVFIQAAIFGKAICASLKELRHGK